ncbi:MAG: alpha-glucan family phosphorylase [Synergistes sp.]|nr:alpha-glucan family phosphorylase [Synergistes sp.]
MINIVVHGHFYQPPRENPWTGKIPREISANPSHDWNERIFGECYKPNSCAKILDSDGCIAEVINNYAFLSFDFGPTLHRWIEGYSSQLNRVLYESGDRALAQAYNHIIMPLADDRDKLTQTIWGREDFKYRYGRAPKGMWLPETAVDTATLETLVSCGIEFTILAQRQCAAVTDNKGTRLTPGGVGLDITRPYICELPSGRSITIFFYNGKLSQDIAFGGLLNNGDRFKDALVAAAVEGDDRILLTAADGETFGHHHMFGEMALARMIQQASLDSRINMPTLEEFLEKHPARAKCVIEENTSWSCAHGVERWRSNCGCHTGGEPGWNQKWRAPLRQAFDNLAAKIDELYDKEVSPYCDPWQLRNEAIEIYKCGIYLDKEVRYERRHAFIKETVGDLPAETCTRLLDLIGMERMRMFAYTSCGWFFNDISGIETEHNIAYALRAAQIAEKLSGREFISPLIKDLGEVPGNASDYPTAAAVAADNIIPYMKSLEEKKKEEETTPKTKKQSEEETTNGMNYKKRFTSTLIDTIEEDPLFRNIAYFSMEIGIRPEIPTYSGGLGILAGDILKSAADLGVPMVGITLLYKKGYFNQKIDANGRQTQLPVNWDPSEYMTKLPNRIRIKLNNRDVTVCAWCYMLVGQTGHKLPIYFLDTDLPENTPEDRQFTAELYGGDNRNRLCQEAVLGIGGLRILRDLAFRNISSYHLNEGHAGFFTLELLREQGYDDFEKIMKKIVFTTHTPVAAGHDFFSYELIEEVMGAYSASLLRKCIGGNGLSMVDLALGARYVNGVSKKHAQVSRKLYGKEDIDWVTNGVHTKTWTSPSFAKLYDKYIPGWSNAPSRLMQALMIPDDEIWQAHQAAKMRLLAYILEETGRELDPDILTIGFARRAATYKRADLVFTDIKRLVDICKGKVQFVFSGKAHPQDEPGKDVLQNIYRVEKEIGKEVPIVFIENYNMGSAKYITSGVDLWLNTPMRPREASGTSGMKCVHNGVMNFSVLDGWWIEGCIEDKTGWAIGPDPSGDDMNNYNEAEDAEDLYNKLEGKVIPTYYGYRNKWIKMMKLAIGLNASYFNTHRVVLEYCEKAYGTVFRGH